MDEKFKQWVVFLEDLIEWVSCIDCEKPAGVHCSQIDLKGGEDACMPCRCREAYEKIKK